MKIRGQKEDKPQKEGEEGNVIKAVKSGRSCFHSLSDEG